MQSCVDSYPHPHDLGLDLDPDPYHDPYHDPDIDPDPDAAPDPYAAVQWRCGACSHLGPRSSNEDRCVVIPDLQFEFNIGGTCLSGCDPVYRSRTEWSEWRDDMMYDDNDIPADDSDSDSGVAYSMGDAFFGVYDGHSGAHASAYL
jgi:hypothetical protein